MSWFRVGRRRSDRVHPPPDPSSTRSSSVPWTTTHKTVTGAPRVFRPDTPGTVSQVWLCQRYGETHENQSRSCFLPECLRLWVPTTSDQCSVHVWVGEPSLPPSLPPSFLSLSLISLSLSMSNEYRRNHGRNNTVIKVNVSQSWGETSRGDSDSGHENNPSKGRRKFL